MERVNEFINMLLKLQIEDNIPSPKLKTILWCVSWQYSAFHIRFATFPQNVVRIRLIVKKWQQFFKIQDGASRQLEFCWMSTSKMTVAFHKNLQDSHQNSKEMATVFQNSRWRRPPSLILVNMHFWSDSCVLCQSLNISTKFSEDRSNSKEMATHFRNSRWWRPPSWTLVNMRFWSDSSVYTMSDSEQSHQIWWGLVQ